MGDAEKVGGKAKEGKRIREEKEKGRELRDRKVCVGGERDMQKERGTKETEWGVRREREG